MQLILGVGFSSLELKSCGDHWPMQVGPSCCQRLLQQQPAFLLCLSAALPSSLFTRFCFCSCLWALLWWQGLGSLVILLVPCSPSEETHSTDFSADLALLARKRWELELRELPLYLHCLTPTQALGSKTSFSSPVNAVWAVKLSWTCCLARTVGWEVLHLPVSLDKSTSPCWRNCLLWRRR